MKRNQVERHLISKLFWRSIQNMAFFLFSIKLFPGFENPKGFAFGILVKCPLKQQGKN